MKILDRFMKRSMLPAGSESAFDFFTGCGDYAPYGYVRLSDVPEIKTAINRISELLAIMTIHLKENTEHGDRRVVNGLSRIIDISPTPYLTRQTWVQKIVRDMLVYGNAFALPKYDSDTGHLLEITPISSKKVTLIEPGRVELYEIEINRKRYSPTDVLHFVLNPRSDYTNWGEGYSVELQDVKENLKQASVIRKRFLSNKVLPPLVISMNTSSDILRTKEGRQAVYKNYFESTERGLPWIVPDDTFNFKELKPLTLKDIAITETMTLDKKTVSAVFGLPSFFLGVGDFKSEEFNSFVRTKLLVYAQIIEQELTKKLLLSPNMYFKFNPWGLYAYGLETLARIGTELRSQGVVTGNEVRDWVGLAPIDGLNDLVMLENYIPKEKIGEQKKLSEDKQKGD